MNEIYKLKPCPFCGGDKCRVRWFGVNDTEPRYYVECESCEAHSNAFENEKSAVEAWNRRTGDDG